MDRLTRAEIELEFRESSFVDLLKEIKNSRMEKRKDVVDYINKTLPSVLEGLLALDQQRIIRNYAHLKRLGMTIDAKTKNEAEKILSKISRLRNQGCSNLSRKQEEKLHRENLLYKLSIPGVLITFCYDISSLLSQNLINEEFSMINVPIKLPNGEVLVYPLDGVDAEEIIGKLYESGYEVSRKGLEFDNLTEAKRELQQAKTALKNAKSGPKTPVILNDESEDEVSEGFYDVSETYNSDEDEQEYESDDE